MGMLHPVIAVRKAIDLPVKPVTHREDHERGREKTDGEFAFDGASHVGF